MHSNIELSHTPLLSICIPTYNRAEILEENLTRILALPSMDLEVQIVVSDNASTDRTQQIVQKIIEQHPDKNIKYRRNPENVRDSNFLLALKAGDGIYCKLFNDYTSLTEKLLSHLKSKVAKYRDCDRSKTMLSFAFDLPGKKGRVGEIYPDGINQFVVLLSNKLTWITNFGCFREQLDELDQFDKYRSLMMIQLAWQLHLAKTRHTIIVCPVAGIYTIPVPNSKRPTAYNFFTPHVENYYYLISQFTRLTPLEAMVDKTHLLKDFVGNSAVDYLILKKECPYDLTGSWKILNKHFRWIPYYYFFIPVKLLRPLAAKVRNFSRRMRGKK